MPGVCLIIIFLGPSLALIAGQNGKIGRLNNRPAGLCSILFGHDLWRKISRVQVSCPFRGGLALICNAWRVFNLCFREGPTRNDAQSTTDVHCRFLQSPSLSHSRNVGAIRSPQPHTTSWKSSCRTTLRSVFLLQYALASVPRNIIYFLPMTTLLSTSVYFFTGRSKGGRS